LHGLLVFGLGLLLTSGSLWLLAQVVASPPRAVELTVLVVANLAATVLRFVLLREWVFSRARVMPRAPALPPPIAEEIS
ncbi:MAG: hypothetical protein QOD45_1471, partial [Pseudonocardiales bacterium]|nr:hypothetical protein [Pseudonocardiales bacterium]